MDYAPGILLMTLADCIFSHLDHTATSQASRFLRLSIEGLSAAVNKTYRQLHSDPVNRNYV